jgi:6,7-dimethyl-8-ribityllumazine synthase
MAQGPLRGKTQGKRSARGTPVAIVVSRYHDSITSKLLQGAIAEYVSRGGAKDDVFVVDAPGSFELPTLAAESAMCGVFDAVIVLGCVVKGETSHDQHLSTAVANEIARIGVDTGCPMGFGLLTVETMAQAEARAGGAQGNKGEEAMAAALDTLESLERLAAHVELFADDEDDDFDDDDEDDRPAPAATGKRSR